ncbi:MAG: hypothetical protein COU06_00920 [Candidatus Harrisonbacteria bacterium CG10_big_fil_rev_8_21_14_0_10_38_8]|uniref:Type II secretion system protein GspF domain-containing protein n=1 Tax=Candidatus Harrisonbacteria bacterium CG10_big_fil_rev_8_21_14_0_10_38_8 TaxID=1974582 RepID=A0A2M6WKC6_9BACT|nr:MAG: hypothetical protein COU06_00920 [Candidatus Harrisonbacteria bacterium CG10_big_fil_rev_8_21_14_0_10_38_8]
MKKFYESLENSGKIYIDMEEDIKKKETFSQESQGMVEKSGKKKKEAKAPSTFEQMTQNLFLRVSLQERVLFARHLAVGIKAGMTLQDSLRLILRQSKSSAMKKILNQIIEDTSAGMYLSASMQRFQGVFGQLFINIVNVGETSGTLSENLSYLAQEMKKAKDLRSKVKGAMIYPMVILVATLGIVGGLMIGIFPKILPVFANLKVELPITTKILIAVSNFVTAYTLWIVLGIIFSILAVWVVSHYEWYKRAWHFMLLRLPIIGKIVVKVNISNITRIMGLLLNSGVQVIEAVNITATALENRMYRRELKTAAETLRRGEFFSIYLAKNERMFPIIVVNMIQVGENTGNLVDNLQYLSEFYEQEVDEVLKNMSSIIEPFLLLFMGLLVGFIALSVITPIYQISESLTL